jgi:3-oxoacyl-[acyl-carrier protein] reductase
MFDLSGRKALVTGATGGLGGAIARALHAQGATVALSGTRRAALDELAGALGERAHIVEANLADKDAVEALVPAAEAAMGGLDILVNNAGVTRDNLFLRMKDEEWETVIAVNLTAAFRLSRAAVKGMMRRRYGRIVNIGSVTSVAGYAGLGPYSASRGGIKQLTMSLADDWGVHGITVNCLAPGWFKTEQNKVMYEDPEWVSYLTDRIPLKRPGQAGDLDGAVVFLASEASAYVTGQILLVDGGISTGAVRALPLRKS